MSADLLKFVVLDEEDLEVVSAHVQDAVVKAADVMWRPQEKRLVIGLNRFDWEGAQNGSPEYQRRRAALRFERVLACKCRDMDPHGKDVVLNLLAVEFTEKDAPSGVVTLTFSGGKALRLEVECLEAELADLGPSWAACGCPGHTVVEGEALRAADSEPGGKPEAH
jgi:Protein of unknown function (DUF2948)